jgi:hypothetical protein
MRILWDAADSFSLAMNLVSNATINTHDLTSYLRRGVVPICPTSINQYAPFRCEEGHYCPYFESHTRLVSERKIGVTHLYERGQLGRAVRNP